MANVIIISAPSGAGKTSLVKDLLTKVDNIQVSISHTTRSPRPGEIDGKDYYFVDTVKFNEKDAHGDFLESADVFGNQYGTSNSKVRNLLDSGIDVILEIDWQGAEQVMKKISTKSIFIIPPSIKSLEERLNSRAQDSDEVIKKRMNQAKSEISHYKNYDYLIVNDDFDKASLELQSIIHSLRLETTIQKEQQKNILNELIG